MKNLRCLLKKQTWDYLLQGLTHRLGRSPICPCCGGLRSTQVDRKFFHTLHECRGCGILFRYPSETSVEMDKFYQAGYSEPGLTTELPSEEELTTLLENNFFGSAKDYHYHVDIFRALGLGSGAKILDFGANWGYATYQFRKAGFDATGFELSRPRAEFGKRLGLEILTTLPSKAETYDAVYSCQVLEHVPNPEETLLEQLRLVRPGGLVIAHTPNGSEAARHANPNAFHRLWGKVHPVLLTDQFILQRFGSLIHYISSDDRPSVLHMWSKEKSQIGALDRTGLFIVLVKQK